TAVSTRSGYTHTAATGGTSGRSGSGLRAFAASVRTLPGVSAPSRVVRSTMEIAVSIAHSLLAFLMLRVASVATRASTPTWSTPGRPNRKRRRVDSSRVTPASSAGGVIGATGITGSVMTPRRTSPRSALQLVSLALLALGPLDLDPAHQRQTVDRQHRRAGRTVARRLVVEPAHETETLHPHGDV